MKSLVFIPGFMLDETIWRLAEPSLACLGRVIHPNIFTGKDIPDIAHKILAVTPDKFVLIGFSMGGYIAREICRLAPNRVEKLVLIATSSRGDTAARKVVKETTLKSVDNFSALSRSSIRRSFVETTPGLDQLIEEIRDTSKRLGKAVFSQQLRMPRESDSTKLSQITCPTLVLAGRFDKLRSVEEAAELVAGIPHAKIKILDTGHMVPLESPGGMADAITEFIGFDQ